MGARTAPRPRRRRQHAWRRSSRDSRRAGQAGAHDDLVGELAVVLADRGPGGELPDRLGGGVRATGPRAVGDDGPAQRPAGARAEQPLELGADVASMTGAFVSLRADDPQIPQGRVVVLADLLDGL